MLQKYGQQIRNKAFWLDGSTEHLNPDVKLTDTDWRAGVCREATSLYDRLVKVMWYVLCHHCWEINLFYDTSLWLRKILVQALGCCGEGSGPAGWVLIETMTLRLKCWLLVLRIFGMFGSIFDGQFSNYMIWRFCILKKAAGLIWILSNSSKTTQI